MAFSSSFLITQDNYLNKSDTDVELEILLICLLYTSDAADEQRGVDLGGRRIIKKLVVTDTIDNHDKIKNVKNIEVLPISALMGEAIKRISNSTSVSDLFK